MRFYKNTLILLLLSICFSAYSEPYSERTSENKQQEFNTKQKVDTLISVFHEQIKHRNFNYDIIDEAITIANQLYYFEGIAKAYSIKGKAFRYQHKYYESVKNHKTALLYFDKTTDTVSRVKCLNELGTTYRKLNLEKDAFETYFHCLELTTKIGDNTIKAYALNGIGNVFLDIKRYETALLYFHKALNLEKQNNNLTGMEYNYANIGEVFVYIQKFDSSEYYMNKAIDVAKQRNTLNDIGPEYLFLGLLYQKKKEYSTSIDYFNKSINMFQLTDNYRYMSNAFINVGINYLYLNNSDKALSFINKGLEYASKIDSKENLILGNEAFIQYYISKKQYKQAFDKQCRLIQLKDSIINDVAIQSIISSQIAYESIEKDLQLDKISQEKLLNKKLAKANFHKFIFSIIIGILFIVLMGLLFYIYRKNTTLKLQNMEKQMQYYINQLKNEEQSFEEKIAKFNFSAREEEVLKLMMQGISNNDIAEALFISINTVKTHIKNIYTKLDTKNRLETINKVNTAK